MFDWFFDADEQSDAGGCSHSRTEFRDGARKSVCRDCGRVFEYENGPGDLSTRVDTGEQDSLFW